MWISSQEELGTVNVNVCLLEEIFLINSLHISFLISPALSKEKKINRKLKESSCASDLCFPD